MSINNPEANWMIRVLNRTKQLFGAPASLWLSILPIYDKFLVEDVETYCGILGQDWTASIYSSCIIQTMDFLPPYPGAVGWSKAVECIECELISPQSGSHHAIVHLTNLSILLPYLERLNQKKWKIIDHLNESRGL